MDRLVFAEAILSNDVKLLYCALKILMNRAQLDYRNLIMRVIPFYDKVNEFYNDLFLNCKELPDLHPDFANSIKLVKGVY